MFCEIVKNTNLFFLVSILLLIIYKMDLNIVDLYCIHKCVSIPINSEKLKNSSFQQVSTTSSSFSARGHTFSVTNNNYNKYDLFISH